MRVAVIGSRTFSDTEKLNRTLSFFIKNKELDVIISGGARGADQAAVKWAKEHGFAAIEYFPDYDKFGKGATFKRNIKIVEDCDMCIAFWVQENGVYSKGTANTIGIAKDKKKPTFIIYC